MIAFPNYDVIHDGRNIIDLSKICGLSIREPSASSELWIISLYTGGTIIGITSSKEDAENVYKHYLKYLTTRVKP